MSAPAVEAPPPSIALVDAPPPLEVAVAPPPESRGDEQATQPGRAPAGSSESGFVAGPAPASEPLASLVEASQSPCDGQQAPSLPSSGQFPATGSFQSFRAPLARTAQWNPPGPKRIGLQAGHWLNEETPPELRRLQHGSSGGGKAEWEVNLDIAQRAKRVLEAAGVEVEVLPTTVPPRYRAHAFVAIHADGDPAGRARGFKIARPGFSSVPEADDRLVASLYGAYAPATALPRDDEHITLRMIYYYAFNSRRYCNAVAPGIPQAIVETGFLTHAADRQVLLGNPEAAARGIANGLLDFLRGS